MQSSLSTGRIRLPTHLTDPLPPETRDGIGRTTVFFVCFRYSPGDAQRLRGRFEDAPSTAAAASVTRFLVAVVALRALETPLVVDRFEDARSLLRGPLWIGFRLAAGRGALTRQLPICLMRRREEASMAEVQNEKTRLTLLLNRARARP